MSDPVADHSRACNGFSAIVVQGEGQWTKASPCPDWDAGGIVEHVIGFHDVLLLRPMHEKPSRPKDDPAARWGVTAPCILEAMNRASAPSPEDDDRESEVNIAGLLPALTTEVLAHTWDLAKAIGVDPRLDPELCDISLRAVRSNTEGLRASGMFGPVVAVPDDSGPAARLIALLGRDPDWMP